MSKPNIFLAADHHFGHLGVCKFLREDGTKLRPWDNPEEMDEALIENHNKIVKPTDKVYFLGDVVINRRAFPTIGRLNGEKILIKGNHDLFRLKEYTPYFKDIRASHPLDGNILTHIPIHPASLSRWAKNIHGHLHSGTVKNGNGSNDKRYLCVSMEHINFTPIALEDLKWLIAKQHENYDIY